MISLLFHCFKGLKCIEPTKKPIKQKTNLFHPVDPLKKKVM